MTATLRGLLVCVGVGLVGSVVPAGGQEAAKRDPLADYLTPDGKLKSPLEVRDEKKGFGVFAGKVWRIEPDGQWSYTEIFRNRPFPRAQGMLDKDQVKNLAMALAQYDALSLQSRGQPLLNPHVLTISFGGRSAELIFGVDQLLVVPDPANGNVDMVGRYGGIVAAMRGLLR